MSDFYAGKRVVVTGGAGMVGTQLCKLLLDAGAYVSVIDDFSRGKNHLDNVNYISPSDASSTRSCRWAFSGSNFRNPEPVFAVFNLAAKVAGVLYNQKNHLDMYNANMPLQSVPLMVAEELGIKHFLQVSSVCVYAPDKNNPCVEDDVGDEPHIANAGYSWSKRMGERLAQLSNIEHVVIVRPSNVYGPMDYFDERAHVIPAMIKKVVHDDEILIKGNTTREFIYNLDIAKGMMSALEYGHHKEVYNIGTNGNYVTIAELVDLIQEIEGTNKTVLFNYDDDHGDNIRYSVTKKAHSHLNWHHEISLRDGLKETIEWYKKSLKKTKSK